MSKQEQSDTPRGTSLRRLGFTPIVVELPTGTTVQLNYLSVGGERRIAELLDASLAPREFTVQFLHSILLDPPVSETELSAWADDDLKLLAETFSALPHTGFGQSIADNVDSFAAFQHAARAHVEETLARFNEMVSGFTNSVASTMMPMISMSESIASMANTSLNLPLTNIKDLVFPIAAAHSSLDPANIVGLAQSINMSRLQGIGSGLSSLDYGVATSSESLRAIASLSQSSAAAIEAMRGALWNSVSALKTPISVQTLIPQLPNWNQHIGRLRSIRKGVEALDEAGYGYSYVLWEMQFFVDLSAIAPEDRTEKVTTELLSVTQGQELEDELRELFISSTSLKPRWDIVREGLADHRIGRFISSIPVLLPQIEGIFSDILVLKDAAMKINSKIFLKKSDGTQGGELKGLDNKISQVRVRTNLDKDVAAFASTYLAPDRNSILHGSDIAYGQAVKSVHLVLVLLCLVLTLREIEEQIEKDVGR